MNPIKKKKKHDYDDDDDRGSKKSKKRRKMDSEEELFINPEDYVEKRRSGRAQRGGRKNYDDNAVPNFSDSPPSDGDVNIGGSSPEGNLLTPLVTKKRGRKKKDSVDEGGDQLEQIVEVIEDPLIVDKILSHRIVKRKKEDTDDESIKAEVKIENPEAMDTVPPTTTPADEATEKPIEPVKTETVVDEEAERKKSEDGSEELTVKKETDGEEEEFFIKWKGYSYIHCVWLFRDEIFDPRFDQKLRRYYSKLGSSMNAPDPDNEDIFNPEFVIIGKYFVCSVQWGIIILKNSDRVLDMVEGADPDSGEPTRHYLVKWCGLPYDECTWELEADVDTVKIDSFKRINRRKPNKKGLERPPLSQWRKLDHPQKFKNDCVLREYQVEGVSWLLFNWYQQRNCILADEMGLGKTIQSITFMQKIHDCGHRGPYLVVVPLSTVGNWIREFETWTDLNAVVYHGSAQSRQMIHQYEMYQRDKKGYPKKGFYILITLERLYMCLRYII